MSDQITLPDPDAKPAAAAAGSAEAADVAAAMPKSSKLVPAMLAFNTLLTIGVVALTFLRPPQVAAAPAAPAKEKHAAKEGEHGEAAEDEEEAPAEGGGGEHGAKPKGPGPTVKLDDFVVRLRNPEADRFARVSFEVQVASDHDKEVLTGSMAKVRDTFIGDLTDRTVEELRGADGLNTVKASLTVKLKALVPNCRVRGLYVTDFIVQ